MSSDELKKIVENTNKIPLQNLQIIIGLEQDIIDLILKSNSPYIFKALEHSLNRKKIEVAIKAIYNAADKSDSAAIIYSAVADPFLADAFDEQFELAISSIAKAKNKQYALIIEEATSNPNLLSRGFEQYKAAINFIASARNEEFASIIKEAVVNSHFLSYSNSNFNLFKSAIASIDSAKNERYATLIKDAIISSNLLTTKFEKNTVHWDINKAQLEKYTHAIISIGRAKNEEYAFIIKEISNKSPLMKTCLEEYKSILAIIPKCNLKSAYMLISLLSDKNFIAYYSEELLAIANFYEYYLNKKEKSSGQELTESQRMRFQDNFINAIAKDSSIIRDLLNMINKFNYESKTINLNSSEIIEEIKDGKQDFNELSLNIIHNLIYKKMSQLK